MALTTNPHCAGPPGPLSACRPVVASADPAGLEKRLQAGRDDLLRRLAGERAQAHRDTAGGGGTGDRHCTVGMHGLDPGRGDDHRKRGRLAHHRCGQVALRRHPGHVRSESEFAKCPTLSMTVSPFSEPAASAPQTGLGSRFLARRCASATVSNQGILHRGIRFLVGSKERIACHHIALSQLPLGGVSAGGLTSSGVLGVWLAGSASGGRSAKVTSTCCSARRWFCST